MLKESGSKKRVVSWHDVPNKEQLIARLNENDPDKRLVITPLLSKDQVADGAIDIRLSSEFIFTRRTEFPCLDVAEAEEFTRNSGRYQQAIRINFGSRVVLHPNELILGSTFEYISMPIDMFAYVLSRSSWGRLGLIIATATAVNPGYKGCLTLEMVNLGRTPLVLYPGLPVAQLILHGASSGKYSASYNCPTGPQSSNVHTKRKEIDFWTYKVNS